MAEQANTELTVTELTDNIFDQLYVLRRRINTGVAYCLKHAGTGQYDQGRERLMSILSREYLPRIDLIKQCIPEAELIAERDVITARLERGWELEGNKKVAAQFYKLLLRYEVYEDIVQCDVINRTMDRIERVV